MNMRGVMDAKQGLGSLSRYKIHLFKLSDLSACIPFTQFIYHKLISSYITYSFFTPNFTHNRCANINLGNNQPLSHFIPQINKKYGILFYWQFKGGLKL